MTPNPDQAPDQALICNMLAVIAERLSTGQNATCPYYKVCEDHRVSGTNPGPTEIRESLDCLYYLCQEQLIKNSEDGLCPIVGPNYPDIQTGSDMINILYTLRVNEITDKGQALLKKCND